MCGNTKILLLVTSIVCIGMNGFNLSSRLLGFREKLREDKSAAYIPDVNDISKWVGGRANSDGIIMALAGVSLVFDVTLLVGTIKENAKQIHATGIWASFDCVVDVIIGFLSANYTMPSFSETKTYNKTAEKNKRAEKEKHAEEEEPTEEQEATQKEEPTEEDKRSKEEEATEKEESTEEEEAAEKEEPTEEDYPTTEEEPAKEEESAEEEKPAAEEEEPFLRRLREARKYSYEMPQVLKGEDEPTRQKTEEAKLGLRKPPPSTIKQLLHFAWVIIRFVIKVEILCRLFSYVTYLRERDEMMRLKESKVAAGGGGTSTTAPSTVE